MKKNNIILIGMPGSGKSTVGVLLAKMLGLDFVDTDLMIQSREKRLLQDILDQEGLERFLEIEEEVICSLSCENSVVAPGGSAVCRKQGAIHLRNLGTVAYLRLSCETLSRRLDNIATRGIAMLPGQSLENIYEQRRPLYERYADLTVDGEEKSARELALELAAQFRGR